MKNKKHLKKVILTCTISLSTVCIYSIPSHAIKTPKSSPTSSPTPTRRMSGLNISGEEPQASTSSSSTLPRRSPSPNLDELDLYSSPQRSPSPNLDNLDLYTAPPEEGEQPQVSGGAPLKVSQEKKAPETVITKKSHVQQKDYSTQTEKEEIIKNLLQDSKSKYSGLINTQNKIVQELHNPNVVGPALIRSYGLNSIVLMNNNTQLSDLGYTGELPKVPLNPLQHTPKDLEENVRMLINIMSSEAGLKSQHDGLKNSLLQNIDDVRNFLATATPHSDPDDLNLASRYLNQYRENLNKSYEKYTMVRSTINKILISPKEPDKNTGIFLDGYYELTGNALRFLNKHTQEVNNLTDRLNSIYNIETNG